MLVSEHYCITINSFFFLHLSVFFFTCIGVRSKSWTSVNTEFKKRYAIYLLAFCTFGKSHNMRAILTKWQTSQSVAILVDMAS